MKGWEDVLMTSQIPSWSAQIQFLGMKGADRSNAQIDRPGFSKFLQLKDFGRGPIDSSK
jgi:hypothetical protein